MTEHHTSVASETAQVRPSRRVSMVWILPIVALVIALWLVYQQWQQQGPVITLELENAQGLEAGKTPIKARSVDIGLVSKIELKPDLSGVIVEAQIHNFAAELMRDGSKFWVVSPKVSITGVSGLNTLLSGSFIAMEPSARGDIVYHFVAQDNPPITPADAPGLHLTLKGHSEDRAYSRGDPVIYKGIKVGQFEETHFDVQKQQVFYQIFIQAPYHQLVTTNTKFWNTSGIKMRLGAGGVAIETSSLEALLTSGVTFGVPDGLEQGALVADNREFEIYANYEQALEQRFSHSAFYLLKIADTVRGLKVGAPVEYRGLEIGKVVDINPGRYIRESDEYALRPQGYTIPVIISIQPGRALLPDNEIGVLQIQQQIDQWITGGLRASLKVGNLLTGGLFVDLQHYPDDIEHPLETVKDMTVIPTVSNEFSQMTQKVTALLDKFNALPLDKLVSEGRETLGSMSDTATSLSQTSARFDALAADLQDRELGASVSRLLKQASQLLSDYSAGSDNYNQLSRTLRELQQTLGQLQPLMLQLNQQPNSLIFGESRKQERIPQVTPASEGASQ